MATDVLEAMAAALGVAPLTAEEQQLLLDCTRDVAHNSERRYAPLSAFLLGAALGASADRAARLRDGVTTVRSVLPTAQDPPAS